MVRSSPGDGCVGDSDSNIGANASYSGTWLPKNILMTSPRKCSVSMTSLSEVSQTFTQSAMHIQKASFLTQVIVKEAQAVSGRRIVAKLHKLNADWPTYELKGRLHFL